MIWASINLFLFVSILFFALRKKVSTFIVERHETLREDVVGVREKLRDAKTKVEDYSAKLQAIDTEVQSLTKQASEDASSVKSKVLNNAKEKSGTLVEEARSRSGSLLGDLKSELVAELAEKVVTKAEGSLRGKLTGADKKRFRKEFAASLNGRQRVRGEA